MSPWLLFLASLSLLADARFDALIESRDAPFNALPAVMQRLVQPDDPTLCQRIRYD